MGKQRYIPKPPRGRIIQALPAPVALPPVVISRTRRTLPRARRGSIATVPPVTFSLPQFLSNRRPKLPTRRAGTVQNVSSGGRGLLVPGLPQYLRHSVRSTPIRRGRIIPPPALTPLFNSGFYLPALIQRRKTPVLPRWHGRISSPPLVGAANVIVQPLPVFVRQRVKPAVVKRGRISQPVRTQAIPQPGPLAPQFMRLAVFAWRAVRPQRGRTIQPPWIGVGKPTPPPVNPVPPNMTGGLSGLSLGKRMHRNKNRPIKSSYDKTLVFRQLWGDD